MHHVPSRSTHVPTVVKLPLISTSLQACWAGNRPEVAQAAHTQQGRGLEHTYILFQPVELVDPQTTLAAFLGRA